MSQTPIYYQDQSTWRPADFERLFWYLNRLWQYLPFPPGTQLPERDSSRHTLAVRQRRVGMRDEELEVMDPARMSRATRYLIHHMLAKRGQLEQAIVLFPNLDPLREVEALEAPLVLSENPSLLHQYYTDHDILI